ncbi:glutathione S-transferase family protein [Caulobacter segnis]|uniref:glutathione S-transferase family protein n=1 Tax=Caulobacter segnis TaxID=88688 RepID=UPI0024105B51|nr:glutathione S-transferase family protein [Caulobacter segnis]MDG2521640.1 glutathione S-transferase family protein [Caulobacter segnis]
MKLYTHDMSPFAARVRLAVYAKGLDIELATPPGGLKSPEYLAINPIGKIPALVLDDGQVIAESDTILEYLEDAFPQVALRPADPKETARQRLIARVGDLYVAAPMSVLFKHLNPRVRDAAVAEQEFAKLEAGLDHLDSHLCDLKPAADGALRLADCQLIPMLHFLPVIEGAFRRPSMIAERPNLAAYWSRASAHPLAVKVCAEIDQGLAALRAGA